MTQLMKQLASPRPLDAGPGFSSPPCWNLGGEGASSRRVMRGKTTSGLLPGRVGSVRGALAAHSSVCSRRLRFPAAGGGGRKMRGRSSDEDAPV